MNNPAACGGVVHLLSVFSQINGGSNMAAELQIRRDVFQKLLTRMVQQRIGSACLGSLQGVYIDHIDVAPDQVIFAQAASAIDVSLPLNVFLVERQQVLAAPNGVPQGVLTPQGTVTVTLELAIFGQSLELRYKGLKLGSLDAILTPDQLAALESKVQSSLQPLPNQDLRPSLAQLNLNPTASNIELTSTAVTIRFDSTSSATRLDAAQAWGLFLDGATLEQMVVNGFRNAQIPPGLTATFTPHWQPQGTLPHIDIDMRIKSDLPNPLAGYADIIGLIRCDLSVANSGTSLRTTVHWKVSSVELYTDFPGFLEWAAEAFIKEVVLPYVNGKVIEAFDPAMFGGTRVDDHTFTIDKPLAPLRFAGARFVYQDALALPDGMTLGGPVYLPSDPGFALIDPAIRTFNKLDTPAVFGCLSFVPKNVTIDQVTASAGVVVNSLGGTKICGFELLPADSFLRTFISNNETDLAIKIPAVYTSRYTQPIQILLQTSRGVRLFDLGIPPKPIVDDKGQVTNVVVQYIDTCNYIDPEVWRWLIGPHLIDILEVTQPGFDDGPGIPPIDWGGFLEGVSGFGLRVFTFRDLMPGELITVKSSSHFATVSANPQGEVRVPMVVPLAKISRDMGSVVVTRLNRQPLKGHLQFDTAMFLCEHILPPGDVINIDVALRHTRITTRREDAFEQHEISALGVQSFQLEYFSPKREQISSMPLLEKMNSLAGVNSVFAVPGFGHLPLALATTSDDTLILDIMNEGEGRVAGVLKGPMGNIKVVRQLAIAAEKERNYVYSVTTQ
jgi:hypothetical protein